MPDESDFSSYAAARWGTVVRLAVLLGLPPSHAAPLAVEAFARLRDHWGSDEETDLDGALYAMLLEVVRADRSAWWRQPRRDDEDLIAGTGLAEIEPLLDRLDQVTRARLVLGAVARLTPEQVDDAVPGASVDDGRGGLRPSPESVGFVADAVVVAPYPASEVRSIADGRRRRRRARRTAAVVTGLVLLIAMVPFVVHELKSATGLAPPSTSTSTSTSSPLSTLPDSGPIPVLPDLVLRASGVPVGWSARDRLHLTGRTVPLRGVVALAAAPEGVVAALDGGRLVIVGFDGGVLDLGRLRVGAGLATEPDEGLVAWVDRTARPELVVRDLTAAADLVRRPVAADAQVVAVDGGLTYVADRRGYSVVWPGTSLVDRHDAVTLLDVASGTRATAPRPGRIRLESDGDATINAAGIGVVLSDDGRYALVREPPGAGARSAYAIVDVQMGTSIMLTLPDEGTAVGAAFSMAGSAREVVFVIARRVAAYDLIACDLRIVSCRVADEVRRTSSAPLLAR